MFYHIAGVASAFFFFICLLGVWVQLRTIWARKKLLPNEYSTAVLSLNHFYVRFIAFYSILVYGFSIQPFNHYLVWSRLPGVFLSSLILWEICQDRKNNSSKVVFYSSLLLLVVALVLWNYTDQFQLPTKSIFKVLLVVVSILITQSDLHQIFLIRKTGHTGAIAITMHQTTLLKDISTCIFGFAIGFEDGWPLIFGAGMNVLTKASILWHFRWARRLKIER